MWRGICIVGLEQARLQGFNELDRGASTFLSMHTDKNVGASHTHKKKITTFTHIKSMEDL